MSQVHELHCDSEPFRAIWRGAKLAEFRRDDRAFATGDTINLSHPTNGHTIEALITHVQPGGSYGIPKNYSMLSLRITQRRTRPRE